MASRNLILLILITFSLCGILPAESQKESKKSKEAKEKTVEKGEKKEETAKAKEEISLKKIFPKKSFFGPSASRMSFSEDGKFAAYTYRPYKERRHGSDLWIYDVEKDQARRVTSVSVMAEFQESARKVARDRIEKAKKRQAKEKAEAEKKAPKTEEKKKEEKTDSTKDEKEKEEKVQDRKSRRSKKKDTESQRDKNVKKKDQQPAFPEAKSMKDSGDRDNNAKSQKKTRRTKERTQKKERGKKGKKASEKNAKQESKDPKKEEKGPSKEEQEEKKRLENLKLADLVDDADATINDEDDKGKKPKVQAPSYRGISSFTWSKDGHELLVLSQGDVYRYDIGKDKLTRLTRTADSERSVAWLPDGSGFTYLRGSSLMKVTFGSSLIEELRLELPPGESLSRYRMSPDGKRVALLSSKTLPPSGVSDKKYTIAKYRDRVMKANQVSRTVLDDPQRVREIGVYIYEPQSPFRETGRLIEVYRRKLDSPGDLLNSPAWSPDSKRIVFSVWDQKAALVLILESTGEEKAKKKRLGEAKKEKAKFLAAKKEKTDKKKLTWDILDKTGDEEKPISRPAKELTRFLHNGGPNTPSMIRPEYLADSHRVVYMSEQSGFRHLHVLDPLYESVQQLTQGRFEVYPIKISPDHKSMFATATKEHPSRTDVYRVDLENGKMTRLSTAKGTYSSVAVSPDGQRVLANFVRFGAPKELVHVNTTAKGEKQRVLTDSHPPLAKELTAPVPTFFTYKNRHGHEISGHMFKPAGWKKTDKRPLLIYHYGGPLGTKKQVTEGDFHRLSYLFAYYMAQKHGYVTCTVDPRGSSGYGGVFEKANFNQVGKPQVEDLVDAADFMVENYGVDAKKVALHGWSFGGFQTQMCLYTAPDVFAAGIAAAGPTEWENYNSWYTRATIGESRTGQADLKKFSLLPLAKNLKSHLLLIHGMEDSNVLYQDTVRVYMELLKAGKETLVEYFVDPTGGHGLGGSIENYGLFRKYEQFLLRAVGGAEKSKTENPKAEHEKSKDKSKEKKEASVEKKDKSEVNREKLKAQKGKSKTQKEKSEGKRTKSKVSQKEAKEKREKSKERKEKSKKRKGKRA